MTEKLYGGASSFGVKSNFDSSKSTKPTFMKDKKSSNKNTSSDMENLNEYIEAGKISIKIKDYARSIIKKEMLLLEIAEKIESKIIELKAKPAFPINLSINEIAAHATPSWNDDQKAHGLLKVDIGIHIDGFVADTAFTIDLENSTENKKLIEAAEKAVNNATETAKIGVTFSKVGAIIEKTIQSYNLEPIRNLSGHSIERYNVHAGMTIPNYDNSQNIEFQPGVYAIEPFSTNGLGLVRDGKPSGIYHLEKEGNVRDPFAREVLAFIEEEYQTLPFCSRWIYKKFGSRGLLALRRIEEAGLLHHYAQLIEKGQGKVAQAEHTIILTNKEKIITT